MNCADVNQNGQIRIPEIRLDPRCGCSKPVLMLLDYDERSYLYWLRNLSTGEHIEKLAAYFKVHKP